MKGSIPIKAGKYVVSDDVTLAVRASDAGTAISIFYRPKHEWHTVIIDEHGKVLARGQPDGVSPMAVLNAVLKTGPLLAAIPPKARPPTKIGRKYRIPSRVKFVLRYAKELGWPTNHAYVLGGFTDGRFVHVLYRVVLGETKCQQSQLRLDGKKIIFAPQIPKGQRLPQTRFTEVCLLREQTTFKLGRKTFRRMSLDELRPLLEGRTLQTGPPKTG